MASGSSPVLPPLPSQAPPTQARVWPYVLPIPTMKNKSSGQSRWGGEGVGWAANEDGETYPYFLPCLLSRPLPLLGMPRLPDGLLQS